MDLIAQFPGDGIDFVTEFLLFLRGKRGEFPDLLEVGGEGIGEISAVDVGKRVFLRLSIFQFVMGDFLMLHLNQVCGLLCPADHSLIIK
ncbi:MAG: hypothetical protein L6W00_16520 [Lentisphaeria bacterium]|nr:MAG: hypothetical protein L6W00_16520 [Lentisphaeria bacterium]